MLINMQLISGVSKQNTASVKASELNNVVKGVLIGNQIAIFVKIVSSS